MVLAPVVRERKGEYGKLLEEMRAQGYARAVVDGELRRLDEEIVLDKKYKHDISIVVDRLVMKEGVRKRLAESIEAASQLAEGLVEVELARRRRHGRARHRTATSPGAKVLSGPERRQARRGARLQREVRLPQLRRLDARARAADLLLQLPARLLPALPRARLPAGDRPGADRPRPDALDLRGRARAVDEGGLDLPPPAARGGRRGQRHRHRRSPGATCPKATANLLLEGTGDRAPHDHATATASAAGAPTRSASTGMLHSLERRYENTDSENTRERIEALMALQPCPECHGARLRPESLAVTVGGLNIYEYTQLSARAALEWIECARADRDRARDRAARRPRDRRAAPLPRLGRDRLPLARARGDHALRRRGAADPARDADRLEPGRRPLHPRRAVDRPAPARQREADRDARAPARPRQHGDRRRARRGHDPRRRPRRRPRPGRRRARRRDRRRGHARGGRAHARVADRPVPLRRARDRASRRSGAGPTARSSSATPASTT